MKRLKDLNKFKELSIVVGTLFIVCTIAFYSFNTRHKISIDAEEPGTANITAISVKDAPIHLTVSNSPSQENVSHSSSQEPDLADMSIQQVEELQENIEDFEFDNTLNTVDLKDLRKLFEDSPINRNTLQVTELIRKKFSDSFEDQDSHFSQVEEFLEMELNDEEKVEEYLGFYKTFTEHEMSQVSDPHPLWLESPENPDEAISLKMEKQQYLRDVFGYDVADTLWGQEAKVHEFKMKRLEILKDDTYSAQVKEQLIEDLKDKTLEETDLDQDIVLDPKAQLHIKLAIYADDLMSMSAEERHDKVKEFRHDFFFPEE